MKLEDRLQQKYLKEGEALYYKKVTAFIKELEDEFGYENLRRNGKEGNSLAPLFHIRWHNESKAIATELARDMPIPKLSYL